MTTPSKSALDAAVKPAGVTWAVFEQGNVNSDAYRIALAYAADLDKADKQSREVLALLADAKAFNTSSWLERAIALLRANLLPEPVDPDLLEARALFEEFHAAEGFTATAKKAPTGECDEYGDMKLILTALKRGRELAKEQDRG